MCVILFIIYGTGVVFKMGESKVKTVCVLMSTYNGEKYLREQIDSIINQVNVKVILFVRDDGSADSTCSILKEYKNENKLEYVCGRNVGYVNSFMTMLRDASEADYYALSDQDDIWDKDKLSIAVSALEKCNDAALYCSNARLVDEKLDFIKNENKRPKISFGSSLVKNFATGCTMVFNNDLKRKVCASNPDYISSHDSWICRVCFAVGGTVIFDDVPHISYRQHGSNVVGSNASNIAKIKNRFMKLKNDNSHSRKRSAEELIRNYKHEMSTQNQKLAGLILNYNRSFGELIAVASSSEFSCGRTMDDIFFRVALLLKWV